MEKTKSYDFLLTTIHLMYLVLSFLIALYAPFYIGGLLIFTHWLHEKIVGDCILTVLQQTYGFAGKQEDFFHYLFRKINLHVDHNITMNLHYAVKTVILIIVLTKAYFFFTT